jgi:uncharacterized protein (TIGR02099 family)
VIRRLAKLLLYAVAGLVGLVLIATLALKLALDRVPAYQEEIKDLVFQKTGFHIRFAHVEPTLRWYGPELYFEGLELRSRDDERVLARAEGGRIAADIWRLIVNQKLLAGRVQLDGPDIAIARVGPNSFALASEIALRQDPRAAALTLEDLPAGEFEIRHGRLTVQNWNAALPQLPLSGVDLQLRRDADELELKFAAHLPPELGGVLNVVGEARGLSDSQTTTWNGDARARDISFAGWRRLLPDYLGTLDAGMGAFDLKAIGSGDTPVRMVLDFSARQVITGPAGARVKFDQIGGLLTLTHGGDRWTLVGDKVQALQAGQHDPPSQFKASWRAAAGLVELSASASYLRAESLLPLTGLLPRPDLRERLRDMALAGEFTDASFSLSRAAGDAPWRMRAHARFHGAGFAPLGRAPGVHGLSGTLDGDETTGRIDLNSHPLAVVWPAQWTQPVTLDSLSGTVYWHRTADQLLVASPGLTATNQDAAVHVLAAWRRPANGDSPELTLAGGLDHGDLTAARNYIPRALIGPKTADWLDRAFVAGRVPHADLVFDGPVRRFPFRDGGGLFLVRLNAENVTLDYQPGWAPLENVSGQAEFRNQGLTASLLSGDLRNGRPGGLKLESGSARFGDFKTAELEVHAAASGDAASAIEYLRATPVDAMADGAFSLVEASGELQATIDLFLPFKDFVNRRILVHAHVDGGSIARLNSPLAATDVTGDADIDNGQVARADFRGRLLGGNFRAQSRTPRNRRVTRTQLEFHGTFSGDALRKMLDLPPSIAVNGLSDWRATLRMVPEPNRERSLRVSSSLAGLEFKLPEPLAKPYGQPLPSWVEVQWSPMPGAAPQIRLALGTVLRAAVAPESNADGLKLGRAAIEFGTDEPVFSDTQTVNVGGSIGRLDLAGWLHLFSADKGSRPLSSYAHTAKVSVDELDYLGLAFRHAGIDLTLGDTHWQAAISGPDVEGMISAPSSPDATDPWNLEFTRLKFEDGPDLGGDKKPGADPHGIPSIAFHSKATIWGERQLGEVNARITKVNDGITLDHLSLTGPSFTATAQGEWRGKDTGVERLQGSMDSSDVQKTLTQLGYADMLAAKSGHASVDLQWVGAPTAENLVEAVGRVQVSLDKGQLIGIKPGAGRVLGLTSIAALPRRLSLDFSDLTDKGFAFDTVRADFDLRDGNAYTDDVLVKGPAAEIGLIGRIGLKNRDYDQTAVVTGSIGNSLPAAGLLAGGPVLGAAVLVFTQVFKQPLKGLARGYYHITGGWDNPTVERITSAEAAAAEAPKGAEATKAAEVPNTADAPQ